MEGRGEAGRGRRRDGLQRVFPVSWRLTLSKVATNSKTRMRMCRAETTNRRSDMAAGWWAQSRRGTPAVGRSTQSWGPELGSGFLSQMGRLGRTPIYGKSLVRGRRRGG